MKFGGDFPYLSNYEEYTMLILVHLKRAMNSNYANVIEDDADFRREEKHKLPNHRGIFDHRRHYHDAHKQALFKDEHDDERKDGVVMNDYSDSDSSDMMEM